MRLWQRDIVKLQSVLWSWFKMSLKTIFNFQPWCDWPPSLPLPSHHTVHYGPAQPGEFQRRTMIFVTGESTGDTLCVPGPRWKIDKWKFMTPGKWSCHVKLTNVSLIIDKRRIENLTNETLKIDECQEWVMTSVTDLIWHSPHSP